MRKISGLKIDEKINSIEDIREKIKGSENNVTREYLIRIFNFYLKSEKINI